MTEKHKPKGQRPLPPPAPPKPTNASKGSYMAPSNVLPPPPKPTEPEGPAPVGKTKAATFKEALDKLLRGSLEQALPDQTPPKVQDSPTADWPTQLSPGAKELQAKVEAKFQEYLAAHPDVGASLKAAAAEYEAHGLKSGAAHQLLEKLAKADKDAEQLRGRLEAERLDRMQAKVKQISQELRDGKIQLMTSKEWAKQNQEAEALANHLASQAAADELMGLAKAQKPPIQVLGEVVAELSKTSQVQRSAIQRSVALINQGAQTIKEINHLGLSKNAQVLLQDLRLLLIKDMQAYTHQLEALVPELQAPDVHLVARGCSLDTDGDGNCPIHPQGCPTTLGQDVKRYDRGEQEMEALAKRLAAEPIFTTHEISPTKPTAAEEARQHLAVNPNWPKAGVPNQNGAAFTQECLDKIHLTSTPVTGPFSAIAAQKSKQDERAIGSMTQEQREATWAGNTHPTVHLLYLAKPTDWYPYVRAEHNRGFLISFLLPAGPQVDYMVSDSTSASGSKSATSASQVHQRVGAGGCAFGPDAIQDALTTYNKLNMNNLHKPWLTVATSKDWTDEAYVVEHLDCAEAGGDTMVQVAVRLPHSHDGNTLLSAIKANRAIWRLRLEAMVPTERHAADGPLYFRVRVVSITASAPACTH